MYSIGFNLTSDPAEQNDLSDQMPEKAAQLEQLWEEWHAGMDTE